MGFSEASRPAWACELKLQAADAKGKNFLSRPAWACEMKSYFEYKRDAGDHVTPRVGV